jgi:flagellar hook-associated protein 2
MAAITSSVGIGSGLEIGTIVQTLVNADTAAKKAQIARQTSNNSAMLSGISSLRSALSVFTTAMGKLNDSTAPAFNAYAGTSANEGVVKVTASNKAVAGSYSIAVEALATSSKVASQSFASSTTAISEGDMVIGVGTGTSYTVKVGAGATLESVRDQINKELGASGISANIVNGKEGSRLVLSSSTTGAGNDISVTGDISELQIDGTQSMSQNANGAGFIEAAAQDAKLTIDGLAVTSSTNKVADAISGLTLELTGVSASSGGTFTGTKVTVATNNDSLKTSIQSFVDAYNTLQKAITSLTSTSEDADGNIVLGSLTNDPTTRSLLGDVRKVLSEVGSGDRLTSLSQLGINTTKDGTLEFNSTKFTAAMNDKKLGNEVQELFTGDNGIIARMNKAIDPYNKTDGSLASRKSGLDKIAKNLSDQQDALNRRIDALTTSLTKQYATLDANLGKMKAQASQITAIFEALNAQAKNS